MKDIVFVIPAYRRVKLASACLKGMRWTCDQLEASGWDATVVVVNDDPEIKDTARQCEFHFLTRPNYTLGKKWNDGIEYAMRELGADLMMPCGSDDILHPDLIRRHLEARDRPDCVPYLVGSNRTTSIVSPDGKKISTLNVTYDGGDGVRALPKETLELVNFRPADDNLSRAMDTSMKREIEKVTGTDIQYAYRDTSPYHVVDFKSNDRQLNGYLECVVAYGMDELEDPFEVLSRHWPNDVLDPIRSVYGV